MSVHAPPATDQAIRLRPVPVVQMNDGVTGEGNARATMGRRLIPDRGR